MLNTQSCKNLGKHKIIIVLNLLFYLFRFTFEWRPLEHLLHNFLLVQNGKFQFKQRGYSTYCTIYNWYVVWNWDYLYFKVCPAISFIFKWIQLKSQTQVIASCDEIWSSKTTEIRDRNLQYVPFVVTLSPGGRTAERYVTPEILQSAVNATLPADLLPTYFGVWSCLAAAKPSWDESYVTIRETEKGRGGVMEKKEGKEKQIERCGKVEGWGRSHSQGLW